MKILIVSQHFWPEEFRINDLALDLKERGYDVTVLTGKPNYPLGKFYPGYSFWTHSKDLFHAIPIYRVPLIARGNANSLNLSLNYISFVISSCIFILFHRKRYDISLTFATSPITQVYPALLHRRLFGSKALLWVQDLWPESVSAAGKVKNHSLMKILNKVVKNIYNQSDIILIQSEAFNACIKAKGNYSTYYLPNWAEDLYVNAEPETNKYIHFFDRKFSIMFAGNLGEAQDIESIIKAAELTKHIKDIQWVIIGDGRKKQWAKSEIARLNLNETVVLAGRHPVSEMPSFFVHANIMLVSLRDEHIFSLTIPSKIQSYMASAKPIVGMLNGIGAQVIQDANCGYTCNAADYGRLAEIVIQSYKDNKAILIEKGNMGKAYYNHHFSKTKIMDQLCKIFEDACNK